MKRLLAIAALTAIASAEEQYQNSETEKYLGLLNKHLAENYLFALIGLTAIVYLYHTTLRVKNHIRHLSSLSGSPGSQRYFAMVSPTMMWVKDHILLAPLWHHRRAAPIKFSKHINLGCIPTRSQAIFLGFVIIYNIFACVWNIPWSNPQLEVLPILRNRSGTLATVNLIPIVIMSTIKNPLINALEINYDTFNLMHRWIGRLSIAQGICHTICYMAAKVVQKGWPALGSSITHSSFIYCGLIAIIGFTTIALQAPKLFRALAYEFFLHFHIALVIMTFVGLWIHLKALPQLKYLMAAIGIWAITRAWRFVTLAYRSFGRGGGCKAIVEALPGDAMRIEFIMPRPWKALPGQTLYMSIPAVGLWTLHPFSVAWNDIHSDLARSLTSKGRLTGDEKHAIGGTRDLKVERMGKQHISLVVKKYDGFTKKLYEKVVASEDASMTFTALVEGPYGHQKSLMSYGTVLLFASGVGITHQMPYVKSLVKGYADGTIATRRITLVWVVPTTDCLEWVRPWMHEILGMDRRREILKVLLFISKATLRQDIKSPSETVRMSRGRPDCRAIVMDEAREQVGTMAISVCAGGGLADEVRRVSRYVVSQGVNLDLIQEGFGW